MFTLQNTAVHFDYTQEQIDKMNELLLELYPYADSEDADEQIMKHYMDRIMENTEL